MLFDKKSRKRKRNVSCRERGRLRPRSRQNGFLYIAEFFLEYYFGRRLQAKSGLL
jgi:hypothetical protein